MKKVNGRRRTRTSRSVRPRDGHLSASRRAAKTGAPSPSNKKKPAEELNDLLRSRGYRDFVREHKFSESRRWRFDFAWLEQKVALEVEGGIWIRGRHTRASGFVKDTEKYNAATLDGWKVYRLPVVKGWKDAAMLYVQTEKLT